MPVDESPTLSDEDKAERYAVYGKSMGITASIDTLDELREEIWSALRNDVNFGDAPDSQDISQYQRYQQCQLYRTCTCTYRNDVNFGDAPDSQDISSVSEHVTILETSRKDLHITVVFRLVVLNVAVNFYRAASKTDSLYNKALKNITAIESTSSVNLSWVLCKLMP